MKTDAWLSAAAATPSGSAADSSPDRMPLFDELVMMVDDEPLMTDLVQTHLEDAGYSNFVVTNDPTQALQLARENDPGVVLLDLMMPGMSGFEVLQQIRADENLRYTPVIVLTAATNAGTKLEALNLGATDFLAKPVDESELALRVRNTLAFRQYNRRLLFFDQATGLPNRRLFERSVRTLFKSAAASREQLVVFDIAVPQGRPVLETLGIAAADHLAKMLAARVIRLAEAGQAAGTSAAHPERPPRVARLGGENYALVIVGLPDVEAVEKLAQQIVDDVAQPVIFEGHEIVPAASIGISIAPGDGDSAEALIMAAEMACSQALQHGASRYDFFSQSLNMRSLERLSLGAQLRHAVSRDQLRLHYQPKVDVASNEIVGVEALVRWQHPQEGLVPPARFIPLAEELGLISEIGEWVIRHACAEVAHWNRTGLPAVKVAVNVSQIQFTGGRLETVLRQALEGSGLPPAQLVVELTESMLLDDAPAALALMHRLKALGIRLSIDDFGTGYSSLSYLKRFPIDELKIDRSFIIDLSARTADLAIARTIVALGHNLGMTVVAEGVETPEQLAALRAIGCDMYQGYLFCKPAEPAQLIERLRSRA